jgi:SNF family Na+-dependent transporter
MESWRSKIGVILAVMGSAIGLGNFLRFPGLAAQYEGGAFMIPYFIALLLLGLPIAWVEWAIGRYGGRKGFNSAPGIFRAVWSSKLAPYAGTMGLVVPVGIYMYYIVIETWCAYYAFHYLTGGLSLGVKDAKVYEAFFLNLVGINANGSLFSGSGSNTFIFLIGCFLLNFFLIYRGLAKGIEIACKIAIPTLFICAILVLIRVLTLGTPNPDIPGQNVLNGLGFMWNPSTATKSLWQSLSNAQMWLDAAGQIFFSLSVGFGVIINYASYLKKDDDVLLSATASVSGNEFAEVALGGMITVTAAFIFLGAQGTQGSVFKLGFITLPLVFEYMPLGNLFGFLWFFLLFLAAITSSISMLQPCIAFFEEGLGTSRRTAVILLGFITLLGSFFVIYFSRDLVALDTFDFWIGTFCIYLLATSIVLIFGWSLGLEKGMAEIEMGSFLKLPKFVGFIIKYISPAYLIIIFILWSYQKVPDYVHKIASVPETRYAVIFILFFIIFLFLLTGTAVQRWRKKEMALIKKEEK